MELWRIIDSKFILCGLLLVYLSDDCLGHVKLTFPPARYPDLDFLDNYRTPPPCGVPKPGAHGLRTSLQAGSTFNVSWFMPYPHQGGFRLELMNEYDQPFAVLSSTSEQYVGLDDQTAQSYQITLPEQECHNCGIRLVRQAAEWGGYQFWSCADVDIYESVPLEKRCSGHGTLLRGECRCERLYYGSQCQYQNECDTSEDCGVNGECMFRDISSHPKRVCYCKQGYFGERCARFSDLRKKDFDVSQYQMRQVGVDNNKIYWKILPDSQELEMILRFPSTTWVGIGWRPSSIDAAQCSNIKNLPGYSEARPEPSPETQPKVPYPEPEGEPVGEPEPVPENEPAPEPTAEETSTETDEESFIPDLPLPGRDGSAKPTGADASTPKAEPQPPKVVTVGVPTFREVTEAVPLLPAKPTEIGGPPAPPPAPVEETTTLAPDEGADVIGDLCYGDWRWPPNCRNCDYRISWSYIEDTDEMEFSVETRAPSNWWTGVGFSATGSMTDADMVIVKSTQSSQMTLHDMFSTGYSAPADDRQQDVYTPTIVGTHVNGVLRATFTRLRNTQDNTDDVKFGDSDNECYYMLFPVSGGRLNPDGSMQKHRRVPVVSKKKVCIRSCLGSSEEVETGGTGTSEASEQACQTEYRFPTGCQGPACDYMASWSFDLEQGDVRFEIAARELGRWTGIGFSRNGNMTNSDIYTGWVHNGKAYVTDRFAFGRQLPAIDPNDRQNIYDVGGKIEDDIQTIWFRRKAVTEDSFSDFPLTECYYFLFPIGGGRILARNEEDFTDPKTPIGFHDLYRPRVSREKICICAPVPTEPEIPVVPDGASALDIRKKRQAVYPEPEPEPKGEPEARPEPRAEPEGEPHAEPEPVTLHPMDCMDMVIGSAIGSLSRVEDFYSLSRATPMKDEWFGGTPSITAAMGYEEDGMTTIMFRRKLNTADSAADHSISHGDMLMTWAKGQEPGLYAHSTDSALEIGKVSKPMYYEQDVFKYHGSKNRGVLNVDFFSKEILDTPYCHGGYAYPQGCSGSQCKYNLQYYRDTTGIHFSLDAEVPTSRWTGVGFSKDGLMRGADMILAVVSESGEVEVTDRFSSGYLRPTADSSQDIFDVSRTYANGRLSAKFSRSLSTGDSVTDVDLNECQYFIYPHTGGRVVEGTAQIRKHIDIPKISSQPICMSQCVAPPKQAHPEPEGEPKGEPEPRPEGHPEPTPEKKPPANQPDINAAGGPTYTGREKSSRYILTLYLKNEKWDENLRNPHTVEYTKLSDRVVGAVDSVLKHELTGYTSSRILSFKKGSVVAEVEVISTGHAPVEIVNAIQTAAVSQGKIDGLQIDPEKIEVRSATSSPTPEQIRNWIIIGVACLLVLIAIVFAVCMILRTKRHKSRDLKAKNRFVPFAPYSYLMSGYPGSYPPGAYGYPTGPLPDKAGYDNQGYPAAADYGRSSAAIHSSHNRQYSNATTATPHGKSPSPETASDSDGQGKSSSGQGRSGSGSETTYGEWMNKVSSQQDGDGGRSGKPSQGGRHKAGKGQGGGNAAPYVSYPNDPNNYYTLNGQNRTNPTSGAGYYRPY